jgi:hypothetical protein
MAKQRRSCYKSGQMLTLAMILDNPGEQPHSTRYRDPRELKALGYSDLIVYPTTALSGLLGPDTLTAPDLRRWVGEQYDAVQKIVAEARAAGMGAWLMFDAPSLAGELVGSAMLCINQQPRMLCPASDELLDMTGQCLDALLARIEGVEGIVLRLGDSDAPKIPYLTGNDIYAPHCSRCSMMGRADRLVRFITYYYDLVVRQLGRRMIVRAWNVRPNGMHDNADVCRRVVDRLPEDDRLILSFKFTQTDFWRFQKWNPSSLVCGGRPIIYELQCQREFEGKGAVPNYQPPLWRNGMTELDGAIGLADVVDRANVAGLWAWVRGGGWRGPYVSADREMWIDANVYAVPQMAADPKASADELAQRWITQRLGITDEAAAAAILQTLRHSTQTVLDTFYISPYARRRHDSWYPSANFIQDDQIDAEAAWAIVQQLSDAEVDRAVAEKVEAEHRVAEDRRVLQRIAGQMDKQWGAAMPQSLEYAETLTQTLRHLIAGLSAYRRQQRRHDPTQIQATLNAMRQCQSAWSSHTGRAAGHAAASAFTSENLWDFTQQIIDEVQSHAQNSGQTAA